MSGNTIIVGDGLVGSINNTMTLGFGPNVPSIIIIPIDPGGPFQADIDMNSAGIILRGALGVPQILGALNSELQLGMFRYAELLYDDELGSVLHLTTWSGETVSEEDEDYALEDGEEDWNTLVAANEDWGFGVLQSDKYQVRLIGTNDSYSEFTAADLINVTTPLGRINRWPVSDVVGQFFIVKVTADTYPEMFRFVGLEITGSRAGRLG